MTETGGCCKCCFKFIITAGFTALFLWLSLRTHKPKCSIEYFYIPALNQSLNSSSNSTVFFDLRLKNQNKDKSVYYDPIYLNLTLVGAPDGTRRPVVNLTEPGFHQGRDKKAIRKKTVDARGVDWKAVSRNGSAVFRLDLVTAVRYKILLWKTKRENLRLGAEVKVNGQGAKEDARGITLSSGADVPGGSPSEVFSTAHSRPTVEALWNLPRVPSSDHQNANLKADFACRHWRPERNDCVHSVFVSQHL